MARASHASSPPNYGAHKIQVIAFLRELLMKGHKSDAPIAVGSKDGQPRLRFWCVNCKTFVIVPAAGSVDVVWCGVAAEKENAK